MHSGHFKMNGNDERQREFKRQQDRLKMMAPDVEKKTVSADEMINNLLTKDTFKKVSDDLPHWIIADSALCCPYYESIWNIVRCSDKMVNTQAISQLLLTSGLHPDILGFIWNLANKTVPGQLTKQELHIVLALVGLAQSNSTFNNLDVLKLVASAPVPRLNVTFPSTVVPLAQNAALSNIRFHSPTLPIAANQPSSGCNLKKKTLPIMPALPNYSAPGTSLRNTSPYEVPPTPTVASNLADLGLNFGASKTVVDTPSSSQLSVVTQQNSLIDDDFQDFQSSVFSSHPSAAISSAPASLPIEPSKQPMLVPFVSSSGNFTLETQNKLINEKAPPENTFKPSEDVLISNLLDASFIEKTFPKVGHLPKPDTTSVQVLDIDAKVEVTLDDFQGMVSDDFSDFQDFQSAELDAEVIQPSKGAIPKLPSFYKVSPESERKLRNLSQPESLSAMPESKISSRNQVSSMPSIAVLGGSQQGAALGYSIPRDPGSRLVNHSAGLKSEKNRQHHKHFKIKPIVPGSAPVVPEEVFPKVLSKPPASFLLKETKIPSTELDREPPISELTRSIEIPIVGTFKETTLPVGMKIPSIEKASFLLGDTKVTPQTANEPVIDSFVGERDIDKYSALRELEEPTLTEDFGEFLSAELTTGKAVEAWNTWNKSVNLAEDGVNEPSQSLTNSQIGIYRNTDIVAASQVPESESNLMVEPSRSIDLLGDSFDLSLPGNSLNGSLIPVPTSLGNYSKNLENLAAEKFDDFGDFVGPNIENMSLEPTEDATSIKSRESSENSEVLPDNSLYTFECNPNKSNGAHQSQVAESLSDLVVKNGVEPREVASKCLYCCHGLLKEAVHIFEGIMDKSILKEVLETKEARNYIKYLQIVHRIAQRVSISGLSEDMTIAEKLSRLWLKLDSIISEYYIPLPEWHEHEGIGQPCAVCKGPTSDHDIHQNGLHYHISCANLWVNCIENTLPCL